ncbi:pirin family protein [Photobacterium alginatilyticum]|uniref:Pirin-like protein n=1 Tax=Photobacterium alginatilyticum TaxID=1775171 RepID=A0ABW9YQ73_9GAMM|nr:pirin family protein [Photobacterium alginatilyticum]NBI55895.1 Pirin-like protein [Photobacterium alginatilyticum]
MNTQPLRIIHRNDLPVGGFAGIVETHMVKSPLIWKDAKNRKDISHGLGDFIYLASGYFKPNEGAPLHPHNDVDIVSVILNGAVGHKGSLGDGTVIEGPGVQVQRAGTGMQHAEFSRNNTKAEILQIWFLPPETGLEPAYQNFALKQGDLTTVLGGNNGESFNSNMVCQVGFIAKGQTVECEQPFIAMISEGTAKANGVFVQAGDLIEGDSLELKSDDSFGLVLIKSK